MLHRRFGVIISWLEKRRERERLINVLRFLFPFYSLSGRLFTSRRVIPLVANALGGRCIAVIPPRR
jgi:hypothetical protein